ncbi:hypothetical protein [Cellvibrio mixtus]|uniref:hypothetical protein n=1 Tax=Cellvibrio mixtus TaxID=39650 RepID=UPI00058712AE|nr:hypothetical protein [Cellvibrio mixtus]
MHLITLICLLILSTQLFANTETNTNITTNKFDYARSVALIIKVDDGGHILQRPDRHDPQNAFVLSFTIVSKYIADMQSAHAGMTLDLNSLQPHDSFLLVNHQTVQTLHLGDHWIGDENSFAVMETNDYQRLKSIFDSIKRSRGKPSPTDALDFYTRDIHQLWEEDSEEFYRKYYFPERGTLTPTSTSENSIKTSSYARSSLPLSKNLPLDINEPVLNQHSSSFAKSSLAVISINDSRENRPVYDSISQDTHLPLKTLLWKIILGCVLIAMAGYWWHRQRK